MSRLTRCLLCRVPLCDGKEWDGAEHMCDTGAADGSTEVAGTCSQYASCQEGYCNCPPDPPSELPTEPELPRESDHLT